MKNIGFLKNSFEAASLAKIESSETKISSFKESISRKNQINDYDLNLQKAKLNASSKQSKTASSPGTPNGSLKRLKDNLMLDKINSNSKKNSRKNSIDNDPIIKETESKKYKCSSQINFILEANHSTNNNEIYPIDTRNFSDINRYFIRFLEKNYGINLTSKTSLPLQSLFDIYNNYLKVNILEKEKLIKSKIETENLKDKFVNLENQKRTLKENYEKLLLDHANLENNLKKSKDVINNSKQNLNNSEKENKVLRTDLLNTIKTKNSLIQIMKNDCSDYRELVTKIVNNVKLYE